MRDKITQKTFVPGSLEKTIEEEKQGLTYEGGKAEGQRLAYIETYGCQMNFSDTEIVASVLGEMNFGFTSDEKEADVVFINTCSIRENAESKVWNRLKQLKSRKRDNPSMLVGVLGCMAERLKDKLIEQEQLVDMVVGPDAYRTLPALIEEAGSGQKAVNVLLSREETYAEIAPVRLNTNGVCAFVTITRGCDNMCTFCVVPFTRGRERSRDPESIVGEVKALYEQGYREVTLLGQNVDSYLFSPDETHKGKQQILKAIKAGEDVPTTNFAELLALTADVAPDLRVRFSTSHPKDIDDEVMHTMARYENICNYIHLPFQSGNSRILELMNRGYTREWYKEKVNRLREIIPDIAISTDIITGFCSETDEEFEDTYTLTEWVGFDHAFMFAYSERPNTAAAKRMEDDVPEAVKKARLQRIIELQLRTSREKNFKDIGKTVKVLIESNSKRSDDDWCGRNDQNKMVVFPKKGNLKPGDYVDVKITEASSATLKGVMV
ncbi:MAG: tRNA (N6-isopentenyl adenosine(37)-C2)-methylthiotransferase MiaB [Bacteroidia bacterium]